MKRILPFALALLVWSCQTPEPLVEPMGTPTPTQVLHFESETAFEDFLELDDEAVATFLATQASRGFVSYATAYLDETHEMRKDDQAEELMDDSFFAQLISEEGLIRIADWYYRINKAEETVYAMHAEHYAQEAQDLVGQNLHNPHLLTFSTEDEVLELIAQYNADTRILNRVEACTNAQENKDTDNRVIPNTRSLVFQHDTFVRYRWYGLGFELDAQVRWRYKKYGDVFTDLWSWDWAEARNVIGEYRESYEVKCGDSPGREWNSVPYYTRLVDNTKKWHFDFYRGSKKLSAYRVEVRMAYQVRECYDDCSDDLFDISGQTDWLTIRSY